MPQETDQVNPERRSSGSSCDSLSSASDSHDYLSSTNSDIHDAIKFSDESHDVKTGD